MASWSTTGRVPCPQAGFPCGSAALPRHMAHGRVLHAWLFGDPDSSLTGRSRSSARMSCQARRRAAHNHWAQASERTLPAPFHVPCGPACCLHSCPPRGSGRWTCRCQGDAPSPQGRPALSRPPPPQLVPGCSRSATSFVEQARTPRRLSLERGPAVEKLLRQGEPPGPSCTASTRHDRGQWRLGSPAGAENASRGAQRCSQEGLPRRERLVHQSPVTALGWPPTPGGGGSRCPCMCSKLLAPLRPHQREHVSRGRVSSDVPLLCCHHI